jgi:hypothetical protein
LAVIAVELLPQRECSKCTANQKVQWGCDRDAKVVLKIDDEEMRRCPRRPILDDPDFYVEFFWLYQNYKRGVLPEDGGINSQPVKLVELFKVTDQALALCERERERRDKVSKKIMDRSKGKS